MQGTQYDLVIVTSNNNSETLQRLFDEKFDQLMFEGVETRGGKFTGDQKIIKLKEKLTLDDIVLEESVRLKIENEIFDFFSMKPIYKKAGLPFKRGVALHGPPGTGKTMLAKIIASTFKETVIWVKAGDVSAVEDINRVFRLARLGRPSVIILEDIDFYTEARESERADKIGIATLMSHLDGLDKDIILTERAVNKALKDIERIQNKNKIGFGTQEE